MAPEAFPRSGRNTGRTTLLSPAGTWRPWGNEEGAAAQLPWEVPVGYYSSSALQGGNREQRVLEGHAVAEAYLSWKRNRFSPEIFCSLVPAHHRDKSRDTSKKDGSIQGTYVTLVLRDPIWMHIFTAHGLRIWGYLPSVGGVGGEFQMDLYPGAPGGFSQAPCWEHVMKTKMDRLSGAGGQGLSELNGPLQWVRRCWLRAAYPSGIWEEGLLAHVGFSPLSLDRSAQHHPFIPSGQLVSKEGGKQSRFLGALWAGHIPSGSQLVLDKPLTLVWRLHLDGDQGLSGSRTPGSGKVRVRDLHGLVFG